MEIQKAAYPTGLRSGGLRRPAAFGLPGRAGAANGEKKSPIAQENRSLADLFSPPKPSFIGPPISIQRAVEPLPGEEQLGTRAKLALGAYRTEQASASRDRRDQLSQLLGIDFYV